MPETTSSQDLPSIDAEAGRSADSLRKLGFCILPPQLDADRIARVVAKMDTLLADPANHMPQPNPNNFPLFTHLADTAAIVPEIMDFVTPTVVGIIEHYFRSHMKIYRSEVYRSKPHDDPPVGSWMWHTDDQPRYLTKIMVYLTKTTSGDLTLAGAGQGGMPGIDLEGDVLVNFETDNFGSLLIKNDFTAAGDLKARDDVILDGTGVLSSATGQNGY